MVGGHGVGREFVVADDAGEQVVEIVRDAAGQRAERFHLLRLEQLGLEFAPRFFALVPHGDVLDRAVHAQGLAGGAKLGPAQHAHPAAAALAGDER